MQQVETDADPPIPPTASMCSSRTWTRTRNRNRTRLYVRDPLGRIAPHATWRMSLNSHVWPSRAAQIGPPLGPGVRQLSGAGARAGVCLVLQLVHYLINGTQPFRGWLLCFIVGFLFDFFLCASSSLFARCCPAAGQLQLQSTNLATISNRQQGGRGC